MAGGRLIVRDLTRMVCLDVRSGLRPAVISNRQESLAMRWENESVKKNR
jgi:hypothetical protein